MEKIVTMLQDELLYKKYSNIGVLHLPKCLRIEMLYKSPFATYEQRPMFVRLQRNVSKCKFQRLIISLIS